MVKELIVRMLTAAFLLATGVAPLLIGPEFRMVFDSPHALLSAMVLLWAAVFAACAARCIIMTVVEFTD
jgi:hypothetical protein